MKKIILITMLLLAMTLFAESGYRYSIRIDAIGDDSNAQELFDTINAGANHLFADANVQFIPKYETNEANDWAFTVTGILPVRKQTDTVAFSGTGQINISMIGATVPLIVVDSLETRLQEWVNIYRTALVSQMIDVTASGSTLVFSSILAGDSYDSPVIANVNGNLSGEVTTIDAILPDVIGIDMQIYKYFYGIANVVDVELSHNRDFH